VRHSENYQDTGHTTGFYQGVTAERERIIKMLETRNRNKTHSEGRYCGLCEAIYLIKGEK
jgi:hypothetical protein